MRSNLNIAKQLNISDSGLSNLGETIKKAIDLSLELAPLWASSDFKNKERLQKLVFPDGIIYDRQKGDYQTERINSVFSLAASLARASEQKEKGQNGLKTCSSPSAGRSSQISNHFIDDLVAISAFFSEHPPKFTQP